MKRSNWIVIKWIVYILILLFMLIIQTAAGFLGIFGVRMNLIIPFVVSVSMLENEKSAAAIGAIAGAFWDSYTTKFFGFSSIIIMLCCVAIALLVMYLIKCNFVNAIMFCAAVLVVYYFMEYLFYYIIWNYENIHILFLKHTLPSVCFTLLVCPLIFIITRKMVYKFNEKIEVK